MSPLTKFLAGPVALVSLLLVAVLAVSGPPLGTPAGAQPSATIDWDDPLAPSGTPRIGDAPDDQVLDLFIGLVTDHAGLAARAGAVSDPTSASYGDYRPVAQLAADHGASAVHLEAFTAGWIAAGTQATVDVTGTFATVSPTVAQAEQVLGVTFGEYAIDEGGTTYEVVAPDAIPDPVPASFAGVAVVRGLDVVIGEETTPSSGPSAVVQATPLPSYPVDGGTPTRTGTPDPSACPESLAIVDPLVEGPQGFTPDQILTAHGVTALHEAGFTGRGTRLALVEAGPFQESDVAAYAACFGLPVPHTVVHGSQPVSENSVEASLDIQVLLATVPDAERIDVFQNPFDSAVTIPTFLSAPLDIDQTGGVAPDVVSVSYGYCESLVDDPAVLAYAEQVLAMAAGAGIGYYVAAGDSGSSGCYHNDPTMSQIATSYPGTSAWVTTVGGTSLTLQDDNTIAEQGVWNDTSFFAPPQTADTLFGGGGGVSTLIDRPAWQRGATVDAGADRLVPDVALYADSYPGWLMYCTPVAAGCEASGWLKVGGTSAATPLMAGIGALATQATRQAGVTRPGFVSPLLYQLAEDEGTRASVFRDVVLGNNDLFDLGCCDAAVGYDQASGWGSVDGAGFVAAITPVPDPTTTTTTGSTTTTAAKPSDGVVTPRFTA